MVKKFKILELFSELNMINPQIQLQLQLITKLMLQWAELMDPPMAHQLLLLLIK